MVLLPGNWLSTETGPTFAALTRRTVVVALTGKNPVNCDSIQRHPNAARGRRRSRDIADASNDRSGPNATDSCVYIYAPWDYFFRAGNAGSLYCALQS